MSYKISLIAEEDINSIIPLLVQLNPKISVKILEKRLEEMMQHRYQCVGVFDQNRLIGISGIWTLTKYYVGKHIEPDNVYILPEYRGRGIGKELMEWIFDYAKSIGCLASELNCYTKNKAGQDFWKSQGYEVVAYHYQKQLQ